MRSVTAFLLLATLIGCAPRVASAPPPVRRVATCGGDAPEPIATRADERALFREAHDQARASPAWGRGLGSIEAPRGFVRLPEPRRRAPDSDEAETGEEFLSDEDRRDQVAAYRFEGSENDPVFTATVRYFRRPVLAARPASLFRHVVAAWDSSREDVTPDVEDAELRLWFNWLDELAGPRGRRVVEWGLVEKGCDRGERFERFIEDEGFLWHVRLDALGTVPSRDLADWLARFFDAPFGAPWSERRAALGHERTPR